VARGRRVERIERRVVFETQDATLFEQPHTESAEIVVACIPLAGCIGGAPVEPHAQPHARLARIVNQRRVG